MSDEGRIFTLAGYQDQRCLVPTNSASIVVFGGLEAFEKMIGVPLDVTARINYVSITMRNLIRNLNLDGCIFCRLWTRYATP